MQLLIGERLIVDEEQVVLSEVSYAGVLSCRIKQPADDVLCSERITGDDLRVDHYCICQLIAACQPSRIGAGAKTKPPMPDPGQP